MKESVGIVLWLLTTTIMTAVIVGITYLAIGKIPLVVLVATLLYEGAMVAVLWAFYMYVLIEKKE